MDVCKIGHTQTTEITLTVGDAPDLKAVNNSIVVVPQRIEIKYRWVDPEYRSQWYRAGRSHANVHGPRRLKAGGVGEQVHTVSLNHAWADQRPEWLAKIVADNMPTGWEK